MRPFTEGLKSFAKSKFFIIAASIVAFITALSLTLSVMGRNDIIKSALNIMAIPFRTAASYCGRAVDGFVDYFTEYDRLKEENESLRQQLEDALSKNEEAEIAIEENKWLREFLFGDENGESVLVTDASVVGVSSGNYLTSISLNKGSLHGVKKGNAVVTDAGLVGYVSEVGLNYSKVSALTNGEVFVGAICPRSGAIGTLGSDLNYFDGSVCRLTLANENADIVEGDIIVTSGNGSIYPYGIKIGRVVSVDLDEYERRLTAEIEISADLNGIHRVMILELKEAENE